jgi:spermidine synthase
MVRALVPGGAAATQCEQPFFDTELIKTIYQSAKALTKNPAYYYANIPTYPGGGIGFMYVSDTPWENGLQTPFPPGENNISTLKFTRRHSPCLNFSGKNCTDR